jgi:hypothetical protein
MSVLEQELLGAARRRAGLASGGRRRLPSASGTVVAMLAGVAVVVVVVAVVVLSGGHNPGATPPVASGSAVERRLIGELGILRRPQHPPPVSPATMRRVRAGASELFVPRAPVARMIVRRVVTAPPRERLLVVFAAARGAAGRRPQQLLAVYAHGQASAEPAATVMRRGMIALERSDAGGTSVAVVVPDGVARVRLDIRPGVVTPSSATVRDNVAQFHVIGLRIGAIAADAGMTWYGAPRWAIREVAPARAGP